MIIVFGTQNGDFQPTEGEYQILPPIDNNSKQDKKNDYETFKREQKYIPKTEIDLSKSGTGLFPGDFYMNRHVKRVILPDYTDTVPANMFKGCINLKEVTLPIDPDIGEAAFEGCISLTDIHIPLCIGSIAANAFRGCRENIRFHADSPIVDPKILKQHIEKELGHSIELHDISGNLVISTD